MESRKMLAGSVSARERRIANVLVVEDEVLIRMIVSDGLRDAGYSVIEAMNGDEAAEILNSGALIDLVFSDVRNARRPRRPRAAWFRQDLVSNVADCHNLWPSAVRTCSR